MSNKSKIEFEGFEEVIYRLSKLGANVKGTTEKALKETHKLITQKADEAVQKANLPAKGKYSTGATEKSLVREAEITWEGTEASVKTGFSISKGGLASIFMMYGTPRHMKNQKMYNAFFGSKTKKEIIKLQEDIFYDELRRLEK